MRQQLDIYASVVLCKSVPGVPTRHRDVDFAIIRENTEGEYSGLEHTVCHKLIPLWGGLAPAECHHHLAPPNSSPCRPRSPRPELSSRSRS